MKLIIATAMAMGLTIGALKAASSETELVAAVLIAEAGGEYVGADKQDGMRAVLEVIYNRSAARRQTPTEVVTARLQFSCLNGTTPAALVAKAKTHRRWPQALLLASARPAKRLVAGATHYHAVGIKTPPWAQGVQPVALIGHHVFYK